MAADSQYDAGFLDGDGSVAFPTPRPKDRWPFPSVSAVQSYNRREPPELRHLQRRFEGSIVATREPTETARRQWRFLGKCSSSEKLLSVISNHGIVKKPQADLALRYLAEDRHRHESAKRLRGDDETSQKGSPAKRAYRCGECGSPAKGHTCIDAAEQSRPEYYAKEVMREKRSVHSVPIDSDRLTIPYLAGFFAAEGTVGLQHKKRGYVLRSDISQTSCPRLLFAIREKLGYGSVSGGRLVFGAAASAIFLRSILPYLRRSQKRKQVEVVLEYLRYSAAVGNPRNKNHGHPDDVRKKVERFAKKIKKLKRR